MRCFDENWRLGKSGQKRVGHGLDFSTDITKCWIFGSENLAEISFQDSLPDNIHPTSQPASLALVICIASWAFWGFDNLGAKV